MAFTDREILKMQQAGALGTSGATNAVDAVAKSHTKTIHILKTGTENAATNVAEWFAGVVNRKSRTSSIKYLSATAVANDTTDYVVLKVFQGTGATLIGSYNSHTSAQGATTAKTPASFSLVSNSDVVIAAGTPISYEVKKYGAGKAVDVGVIAVDLEEV
jgi:hypothetical protein